jgi:hypothetical protein
MSSFLYSLQYTTRYEEVSPELIYFGEAAPGAAESAPIWRIKRLTTVGGLNTVHYADGTNNFNNVWADRASLSYS